MRETVRPTDDWTGLCLAGVTAAVAANAAVVVVARDGDGRRARSCSQPPPVTAVGNWRERLRREKL